MALIKCPECGKEISDKATQCINCGYPIKNESENNEELFYINGNPFSIGGKFLNGIKNAVANNDSKTLEQIAFRLSARMKMSIREADDFLGDFIQNDFKVIDKWKDYHSHNENENINSYVCVINGHLFEVDNDFTNTIKTLAKNNDAVKLHKVAVNLSNLTKMTEDESVDLISEFIKNNFTVTDKYRNYNTTVPVPRCPMCGSADISKISTMGRVSSIVGFGILSKKIGKQWQCNNPKCKHMW